MTGNMPKTRYKVICFEEDDGTSYLIIRDKDSGESVIYMNGWEMKDAKALGMVDLVVGAFAKITDMDEEEVERSPSVDPTYSDAPLIDIESWMGNVPEGTGKTVIIRDRSRGKYIVPRTRRPFSYDVESDSYNAVLEDALNRFVRVVERKRQERISDEFGDIYPSLRADGPSRPKRCVVRGPEGNIPAREAVRQGKADASLDDAPIAKARGFYQLGTKESVPRWQKFWAEMEDIEKKKENGQ